MPSLLYMNKIEKQLDNFVASDIVKEKISSEV